MNLYMYFGALRHNGQIQPFPARESCQTPVAAPATSNGSESQQCCTVCHRHYPAEAGPQHRAAAHQQDFPIQLALVGQTARYPPPVRPFPLLAYTLQKIFLFQSHGFQPFQNLPAPAKRRGTPPYSWGN